MKAILFALALFPIALFAEGIPKDEDGNLAFPHLTISLNESQIEEIETLDSVTLTTTQWKEIRKTSPNTPKRLEGILPINHNDCTCGYSYSAILLDKKKLALFIEEQDVESIELLLENGKNLTLRVDQRGQFYLDGVLTRFTNLLAALESSEQAPTRTKQDTEWVAIGTAAIETPPLMSPTSPIYAARVLEVGNLLESKGWSVQGMSYYALNDEN
ncbi:MAG: hypothetical protein ACSHYB_12990 [Roseibacillus sp.]